MDEEVLHDAVGQWLDERDDPLPQGHPFVMDVWGGPTHCGWAELPSDAIDTGYHRNGWSLWVSKRSIDKAVWLVHASAVERWPAAKQAFACA